MKKAHDINKLEGDGYLILPLSMSRLAVGHGQDPEWCYKVVEFFTPKLGSYSSDVIFLYTYGLYFNTDDAAFESRKKLNQQILNHSSALRTMIEKRKKFIPTAFHYLPFDYVVLNSPYFGEFFQTLKKLEKNDKDFREQLAKDMMGREYTEANINFLLEEVTGAHILKQHLVDLPRTLVKRDVWRLLAYPGELMHSSAYQWQKKILPQKDKINPYGAGQYDYDNKTFNNYEDLDLSS